MKYNPPAGWRKTIYVVVGAVLSVLAVLGVVTSDETENVLEQVDTLLLVIASASQFLAARNVEPTST